MKRVLLTGASGFVGRHCLLPLLSSGYQVHAVSRSGLPVSDVPGVRWHRADLLDPLRCQALCAEVRPTHLLHLAWCAEPGSYRTSPDNLRWVQATLELLLSFGAHGGERALGVGSCIEYRMQEAPLSEALTPLLPSTLYGACKHSVHVMLEAFAQQLGFSAAWGRVFYLYGPHEHPARFIPSILRAVLKGQPARSSHGRQQRDFLYVEDAAAALCALLDSAVSGAVNIASGAPVALKDILAKIAGKTGSRALIQLGALPTAADEPPVIAAEVSRLQKEVGWVPHHTLDQGLQKTIHWWNQTLQRDFMGERRLA